MQFSSKKIVANLIDKEEQRIAILETNGRLDEIFISDAENPDSIGAIYKAKINNIVKGMNSAFLDLGDGQTAFLYLGETHETFTQGQHIIVQIVKPAVKGKVARATTKISLSSHSLVLLPGERTVGVSKNITDDEKRVALHKLASKIRPKGFGVIIRTLALDVTEADLSNEIDKLVHRWQEITDASAHLTHPALLYRESNLLEKVLKKYLSNQFDEIVTDDESSVEEIKKIAADTLHEDSVDVSFYNGNTPLFELYGIEKEIALLFERKVWLPSGAFLVIDRTEALTVIDVNSGKFVGKDELADTVLAVNLEACEEIARQLRLRAIGGIVVVDFIDMFSHEDAEQVIARLEAIFKDDRSKIQLYGITNLGLAQITRKKERKELASLLATTCPCCGGKGIIQKPRSIAIQIKRFIRKNISSSRKEALLLECDSEVANYIRKYFLNFWENEFSVKFLFVETCNLPKDNYKLLTAGTLEEVEQSKENYLKRKK